VEPRLNQG